MRRLVLFLIALPVLACSPQSELDCGEEGCDRQPGPAPASESCLGDDWIDDAGSDDGVSRSSLGTLVPDDGALESSDLYPAGDIDIYVWNIAMSSGPLAIGAEIIEGPSTLERCAYVLIDGTIGSAARCTTGEVRAMEGGLQACCALAGSPLVITPDPRSAESGDLVVEVSTAIGGTCNRYAIEVVAADTASPR